MKAWEFADPQYRNIGLKKYNVHTAILLSKDIEPVDVPLKYFDKGNMIAPCSNTLMSFVRHMKSVLEADLSYPILINDEGSVIDGTHRIAKAILNGHETIKCVMFEKDPPACYEDI